MSILDEMNSIFKIETYKAKSLEKDISDLLRYSSITIPDEYLQLIKEKTEIEILVDNQKYIRIWGAEGCMEMNSAYYIQRYIPNSLAIGDDECSNVMLYAYGQKGFGIYIVAFNDLDVNEMIFISNSLKEFFVEGVGTKIFTDIP